MIKNRKQTPKKNKIKKNNPIKKAVIIQIKLSNNKKKLSMIKFKISI